VVAVAGVLARAVSLVTLLGSACITMGSRIGQFTTVILWYANKKEAVRT
jgi:hypothetical protein